DGVLVRVGTEPALAELRESAERLLADANQLDQQQGQERKRRRAAEERLRVAKDRKAEFSRLRDEALFHGTLFTGVDLPGNLQRSQELACRALEVLGVTLANTSKPGLDMALEAEERAQLTRDCHDLLLVWAGAVAQEGSRPRLEEALRILERAVLLGSATHS